MPHRSEKSRDDGHKSKKRKRDSEKVDIKLPAKAKPLKKSHFKEYLPLLGHYLDIQKGIDISTLDGRTVKGRWKSFLGKWNRGELAEGWYLPSIKETAEARDFRKPTETATRKIAQNEDVGDDESDDSIGPTFHVAAKSGGSRSGPSAPTRAQLDERYDLEREQADQDASDRKAARKADRKREKDRFEEAAPRAEAGTRERMLEKKAEKAASNRAFANAGGGAVEVPDRDLMGDDDDDFKRRKEEAARFRSDKEIRRDEIARAKEAEYEEKVKVHREKEAKTMEHFIELAKQRFG